MCQPSKLLQKIHEEYLNNDVPRDISCAMLDSLEIKK